VEQPPAKRIAAKAVRRMRFMFGASFVGIAPGVILNETPPFPRIYVRHPYDWTISVAASTIAPRFGIPAEFQESNGHSD
jgi:hypothetical protein